MDIINELKKDPKFKQAAEKLLYLMSPGLAIMPGPEGAGTDLISLAQDKLPKEIASARVELLTDGSISLICTLQEGHGPFEAMIYTCPSEVGGEMVVWLGERPEDEYTYLLRKEVKEGDSTLVMELGKLKQKSDKSLKEFFDLKRCKLMVRYKK